jgi:hypothetical protein
MCRYVRLLIWLPALGTLAFPGCGEDDGIGQRYRASGVVTYNGNPVPKGTVTFVPEGGGGRVATGDLAEYGSFTLTTHTRGDGALAGKYRVTVLATEGDRSKLPKVGPGIPLIDRKHRPIMKNVVPPKYSNPSTTTLREEVKPQTYYYEIKLAD